jgi:tetratricopeptide (TPR) repeat protein/transcriptional regulator with XRE-family HTH domain
MTEARVAFAGLLRTLRTGAGLTQEELAQASGVSLRTINDLERGAVATPQRETVRLVADALHLIGPPRVQFELAARPGGAGATGVAAATRTLPRDITAFTGRQQELDQLVDAAASAGGVVGIHAIGGMAGVGKTALAVHAAHRVADRFPDGQIFLSLHGHTPGRQPVDPADALASLLLTSGVPVQEIPPGLQARSALWRARLTGRPLLLVLDDAASSEQVNPLLPGTGGSLVLVTSRRRLTALADAAPISLDTLPPDEAAALLVRLSARPRLSPQDPAVHEITGLCGYLPLAMGMVARQLHHHPVWTVASRAAELTSARDRLELMATENVSVAAAFDLSYADLAPEQQRLFRRVGLHPGTDLDAYAAAALDGIDLAAARHGLEVLYDQYLLAEPVQGRYRMHDLIWEHALALASRLDPARDRDQATGRVLDYYQYTAVRADALILGRARIASAAAGNGGPEPAAVPSLADREQALAWARAERGSLLGCLDHVTGTGRGDRIVALTAGLAGLLRHDGPWAEAITRHTTAAAAAGHLADRLGQASALADRGNVRRLTGEHQGAARDLEEALGIYRDLGNPLGQADVLTELGVVRMASDYADAARDLEEALGIYRDLDNRPGQANVLKDLGVIRMASDYAGAARDLQEAQAVYRDLGDRLGQANVLINLGNVRRMSGDYPAAAPVAEEALDIYRDQGNRLGQANALCMLGDVRRQTGDPQGAARDLEQAVGLFRDLSHRGGLAGALTYLGSTRSMSGEYQAAAADLAEALDIFRDIGERGGEVEALNEAGTMYRARGDLSAAGSYHQQALDLAREIGSPWDEAHALAGLGRCALAAGQAAEAQAQLTQALEIFQQIGAVEAAGISRELSALKGP